MTKHLLRLTQSNRDLAHQWVDRAIQNGNGGKPWMLEVKEPTRSLAQNSALWEILGQIVKQRPAHHGRQMSQEAYKAVFMDALGHEVDYMPSLDGKRMFPLGLRSSRLTKDQFSDLLQIILAWAAQEGLTITHFDDAFEGME